MDASYAIDWFLFAIIVALIGRLKGGSGWGWFAAALIVPPVAFIALLVERHDVERLRARLEAIERREAARERDKALVKSRRTIRSSDP